MHVITLLFFKGEGKSVFYKTSKKLQPLSSHKGLSFLLMPSLPAIRIHLRASVVVLQNIAEEFQSKCLLTAAHRHLEGGHLLVPSTSVAQT